MNKVWPVLVAASLGLCAQEPPPPPQGAPPQGARGGMMRYDATKEATFKGTVVEVITPTEAGPRNMVRLVVKVDGKDLSVMVAPDEFLKEKKFTFAKDDALTILGMKMENPRGGGEMLIPREITKGKEVLTLRDKEGMPTFRRQRPQ